MTSMKDTVNSYFAVLLVTIAGAAATMLIVNVAFSNSFAVTFNNSEATYASLQQSLLNQ